MFDVGKIGYSFPAFSITIERSKIRELALAIGDSNPIYQSKEVAQEAGYTDIPFPPTMGTVLLFWGNTQFVENLSELGLDIARLVHREERYEYLAPMHVDEILTGVMTVMDGFSRKGRKNTTLDLVTLQLHYTNAQAQPVLIATTRLVSME